MERKTLSILSTLCLLNKVVSTDNSFKIKEKVETRDGKGYPIIDLSVEIKADRSTGDIFEIAPVLDASANPPAPVPGIHNFGLKEELPNGMLMATGGSEPENRKLVNHQNLRNSILTVSAGNVPAWKGAGPGNGILVAREGALNWRAIAKCKSGCTKNS